MRPGRLACIGTAAHQDLGDYRSKPFPPAISPVCQATRNALYSGGDQRELGGFFTFLYRGGIPGRELERFQAETCKKQAAVRSRRDSFFFFFLMSSCVDSQVVPAIP